MLFLKIDSIRSFWAMFLSSTQLCFRSMERSTACIMSCLKIIDVREVNIFVVAFSLTLIPDVAFTLEE